MAKPKQLPSWIEVVMMKPRADAPALTLWVRRSDLELSTYGVGADGKLVTSHDQVDSEHDVPERWRALVDEQRRDGYHAISRDPAGALAFMRAVESQLGLQFQIAFHHRRAHVDVTTACERWATATTPKQSLVAKLLQCHLEWVDGAPPAVELASRMRELVDADEWTIEDVGPLRLTSPLIASLVKEGEPTTTPAGVGLRYRLPADSAATWFTITYTR